MQGRQVKFEQVLGELVRGVNRGERARILEALGGITASALSQYVTGKNKPTFEKLVALANYFDVSLDYLVFGEPSSAPLDQGFTTRFFEYLMADVRASLSRHTDAATRIGRVIVDRIDEVAKELADSPTAGRGGLMQADEALRTESYSIQSDILAMDLGFNIIMADDDTSAEPGQYLSVVASNVRKGRTYRFLLPGGADHRRLVGTFRELLNSMTDSSYARANCLFRQSPKPLVAGACIYKLDVLALHNENAMLYTQFKKYIDPTGRLGFITRPNLDSNADMLMSLEHTQLAARAFEAQWASARPL